MDPRNTYAEQFLGRSEMHLWFSPYSDRNSRNFCHFGHFSAIFGTFPEIAPASEFCLVGWWAGALLGAWALRKSTGEKVSGSIPAVAHLSGTSYLVLIIRILYIY